jgi:nucleoside-diphosphate-sugar epimerase
VRALVTGPGGFVGGHLRAELGDAFAPFEGDVLDAGTLREAVRGTDIVLVEPYLAGTSAAEVSAALRDRPHRLLALGVVDPELRRYGAGTEHRAAHRLDASGIRQALDAWWAGSTPSG